MGNKPLTIDVESRSIPNGSVNQWSVLSNASVFIRDIRTPALSEKANVGTLVSGIPTAFARVDLFKSAFDAETTDNSSSSARNLAGYYSELVCEWRGFLACLALDYPNIRVKKIDLAYSDHKKIEDTANIYEPSGAFGNMLLERKERWCEQGQADNGVNVPYLNLIKYCGKVVGATAPECLLFTSSAYRVEPSDDRPWVDVHSGKFIDPLKSDLSEIHLSILYAYVDHIIGKLPEIEAYYPQRLKVDYSSIRINLERWKDEIEDYAHSRNYGIWNGSIPPVDSAFHGPFAKLFCYQDLLYGVEGQISERDGIAGAVGFDPKKLLLPPDAKIARIHFSPEFSRNPEKLKDIPVFVLTATKKGAPGEHAFFALPLSAMGLNVYGKAIGPLVGVAPDGARVESTLTAVYNPEASEDNLEVELAIRTENGKIRSYCERYTVGNSEGLRNKDILLWPNFISKQWDRYYLYSELPHNGTTKTYNAYPFAGDPDDEYFRILTDERLNPLLLAENGFIVAPEDKLNVDLLVSSGNAVAENPYKYEIYKSNKPFKGVRLLAPTGEEGGYLIVNYSSDPNTSLPRNMLQHSKILTEVTVGIDFGSTNTSVAYCTANGVAEGFDFTNQRVSLLGQEWNKQTSLKENKVLFFQGREKPLHSNALHSVLTLHDERRLKKLKSGENNLMRMSQEVIGGFPCFMDNLPVHNMSEKSITLKYPGIGLVTQVHNMKWNGDELEIAHKKAFLRTLMLQIYAEMFLLDKVPVKVRWSYPSAMSNYLLSKYQQIWEDLPHLRPVSDYNGNPFGLDVSKFQGILNFINSQKLNPETPSGFGQPSGAQFSVPPTAFSGGLGSSLRTAAQQSAPAGLGNTNIGNGDFASAFMGVSAPKVENTYPDIRPDDPNRILNYVPQPLFKNSNDNFSLTEANAVANFMSSKYANETCALNIIFDIGGSTTDISALYKLSNGLTMIKQNSIRFAAQRVSWATNEVKGFEKVLNLICEQFQITILGLNQGERRYSAETASYYFDQIVDRLSEEQLPAFYKLIAAEAPQLMWINLYVTGLLLYYAGQIARKLTDDLAHVSPQELYPGTNKPQLVRVSFAGKGSRLLQWLSAATHSGLARQYYSQLMGQGFGGWEKIVEIFGQNPQIFIDLPELQKSQDIKYEVSKGLAKSNTDLFNPKDNTPSEIIGEAGFTILSSNGAVTPVSDTNSITPEMIEWIGTIFNPDRSNQCPKFFDFCDIFYSAAQQLFDMKISQEVFMEGFRNMNIVQYVQNMPEYIDAMRDKSQNKGKFDFVAPIIILEGMKFYDDYLLKSLK